MDDNFELTNMIIQQELEDREEDEFLFGLYLSELQERERDQRPRSRHVGSVPGHRTINRNRKDGHERLMRDYFVENPIYDAATFRNRYRMSRDLFLHILNTLVAHNHYFAQEADAFGKMGLSPHQKITAAMRMLAYATPADAIDEYLRLGKTTTIDSLRQFVSTIVNVFGPRYLRSPNESDICRLLTLGEKQGFPGMLGSIDCMHWRWKNCPTSWHGQYTGHCHNPTVILEAVASSDLWIWHAFFGLPGSLNDINVLERSPVFDAIATGKAPTVNFEINGKHYDTGYYLADGIYPQWGCFVKSIQNPLTPQEQYFTRRQESVRKDVERAFGVLQARFAIIREPARLWDVETLGDIMKACIILHNMIIEDEGPNATNDFDGSILEEVVVGGNEEMFNRLGRVTSKDLHTRLRADLVQHVWNTKDRND